MTEAEWLASALKPGLSVRMLEVVRDRGSDRQFRLLACAEIRRCVWLDHGHAQALELAEHITSARNLLGVTKGCILLVPRMFYSPGGPRGR
jgi:hypothetical protein